MPAERARAAGLLCAAIAAGAAVWWWASAAPPPPSATSPGVLPGEPRAAAVPGAVQGSTIAASGAPAAGAPAPAPVERVEIAAPGDGAAVRTAVVGKALDGSGGPLAGFTVLLQCTHRKHPATRSVLEAELARSGDVASVVTQTMVCRTDDAGAFAFEQLAAGSYRCNVAGLETAAEKLTLELGEVRQLELRSPLVALTGTLYRNGAVAKDCLAAFDDGRTRRATPMPDEHGVIRSFAAPGRHQVLVHAVRGVHQGPGWGPCLSKHVLIVPQGTAAMQWRVETGGTEIVFAVEDRDGVPIPTFRVVVEGTGACDNENGRYVVAAGAGSSATIAALPGGRWRAIVDGDDFRVEPRDLVTGIGGPREVVTFVAVRAAPVRVVLHPRTRFFSIPEPSDMPELQYDGGAVACDTSIPTAVTAAAPAFDYRAVPVGKVKLVFADRVDGGELVPLPFEPIAAMAIDVAAGRTNQVDVDVEPRPFVDLGALDRGGAAITVYAGDRRVRSRAKNEARWIGWLPHGDYRVVVERKGVRTEQSLRVDRPHIRERYKL